MFLCWHSILPFMTNYSESESVPLFFKSVKCSRLYFIIHIYTVNGLTPSTITLKDVCLQTYN